MADDKKLERVRALLAKAADPAATEAEAEAFNTKAAELMARYAIDTAMLAAAGKDTAGEKVEVRQIKIGAPYGVPKANLLHSIAKFNSARAIMTTLGNGAWAKVPHSTIIGYTSDLDRVEFLYTNLLMQAAPLMLAKLPPEAHLRRRKLDLSSYRYDLLSGFRDAVHVRLQTVHERTQREVQAETTSGPSVELVLRNREQDVDARVNQEFPHLGSSKGRTAGHLGYSKGYEAGKNADLQQTRVGGNRTAISR